jgi:outer membrane protein
MKKLFCLIVLLFCVYGSFAQTKKPAAKKPVVAAKKSTSNFKFGYIYEDYILENYAELKKLDEEIKAKTLKLQDGYNKLAIEYQTRYLDYQNSMKNLDSMTTEKLNAKLKSVQEVKEAGDNFQREAEKQVQQMTGDGIVLVKANIKTAAESVAAEKGFQYVIIRQKAESLINGNKMVLYYKDGGLNNLSDAVLVKLGSKPPVKK